MSESTSEGHVESPVDEQLVSHVVPMKRTTNGRTGATSAARPS